MISNLISFDLEIYDELPEGTTNPDLTTIIPSVAAFAINSFELDEVKYFFDIPHMTKETAGIIVNEMLEYHKAGYRVYGWNILGFDLPIMAHYSGMKKEVSMLALNSIDPMFIVHCNKGYYLGLDKVLTGCGLETKIHSVKLNDGSICSDMGGAKAPMLWRNGEHAAVMEYLAGDVVQPLKLADFIDSKGHMTWTSNAGKKQTLRTELITVKDALKLPEVDQSWMSNPKSRKSYLEWMDDGVLEENGIKL